MNNKFFLSYYNIVVKRDSKNVTLYNSFSGSIVLIEQEYFDMMMNGDFDFIPNEITNELYKNGFLKKNDYNEFNKIVFEEKKYLYNQETRTIHLVIAPTLRCNLNCDYCFEKRNDQSMDVEMIDDLLKFIKKLIIKSTKKICVSWFGGEPTLEKTFITDFSKRIINDIIIKNNLEYSASIITNGTLLNRAYIDLLVDECKITKFQISLDGNCENFCTIKHGIKEQFSNVIGSIKYISSKTKVSIRLNNNSSNYLELKKICFDLIEMCDAKNIHFYLAKVVNYGALCNDFFLTQEEYEKNKINLQNEIKEKYGEKYSYSIPKHSHTFCNLCALNNYVIGPNGELYKCEHDLGIDSKIIGDIKNGLYFTDYYTKFIDFNYSESCRQCKIFPICMGGCPQHRKQFENGDCCFWTLDYIKKFISDIFWKEKKL